MSDHSNGGDRRPSATDRARLAGDLHRELGTSRLAWDAALLRSDAAIAGGDEDEVRAALDDHRLLLQILEQRIGEVVATAAQARIGDPTPDEPALLESTTGSNGGPRDRLATVLHRAGVLLGTAAAVLAVVAVGVGDPPIGPQTTVARSEQDARSVDAGFDARTAEETRSPLPDGGLPSPTLVPERSITPLESPTPRTSPGEPPGDDATPPADPAPTSGGPGTVPAIPELPTAEPGEDDEPPRIVELFDRFGGVGDATDQDASSSLPGEFRDLIAP
ncbi:MAG: hypothetical protein WEB03_13020 [Nitriliruptor sp.]|uniref:hypothetical protein n=1 Tax=Nitriliruptor sp. TaxID=2448056 RepID=UPI0034A002D1